mmetsp:Transcript_40144/g.125704  ORF Transcript_40144/g.125704 Transcript_40144/m.125704 type:complete len:251 (-) Transcript_40144:1542-2294(-)
MWLMPISSRPLSSSSLVMLFLLWQRPRKHVSTAVPAFSTSASASCSFVSALRASMDMWRAPASAAPCPWPPWRYHSLNSASSMKPLPSSSRRIRSSSIFAFESCTSFSEPMRLRPSTNSSVVVRPLPSVSKTLNAASMSAPEFLRMWYSVSSASPTTRAEPRCAASSSTTCFRLRRYLPKRAKLTSPSPSLSPQRPQTSSTSSPAGLRTPTARSASTKSSLATRFMPASSSALRMKSASTLALRPPSSSP